MVFVPCRDGISHSPLEHADPADAALAAEIILKAILALGLTSACERVRARQEGEPERPDDGDGDEACPAPSRKRERQPE